MSIIVEESVGLLNWQHSDARRDSTLDLPAGASDDRGIRPKAVVPN